MWPSFLPSHTCLSRSEVQMPALVPALPRKEKVKLLQKRGLSHKEMCEVLDLDPEETDRDRDRARSQAPWPSMVLFLEPPDNSPQVSHHPRTLTATCVIGLLRENPGPSRYIIYPSCDRTQESGTNDTTTGPMPPIGIIHPPETTGQK